jgi:hypothetical protein
MKICFTIFIIYKNISSIISIPSLLQGGKTEYIVTIACVIGRSRMKGERIVTTLLPYGPEKPR